MRHGIHHSYKKRRDSNQNIVTTCKYKLRLTELKYLFIKSTEKLFKDECM